MTGHFSNQLVLMVPTIFISFVATPILVCTIVPHHMLFKKGSIVFNPSHFYAIFSSLTCQHNVDGHRDHQKSRPKSELALFICLTASPIPPLFTLGSSPMPPISFLKTGISTRFCTDIGWEIGEGDSWNLWNGNLVGCMLVQGQVPREHASAG